MRYLLTPVALLVVVLSGCRDATAPPDPIVGTWHLISVNGFSVPYTISRIGTTTAELIADTLWVRSNGSFTRRWIRRTTTSTEVTTQAATDSGTWSANATGATFLFMSDSTTRSGPFRQTSLWLFMGPLLHIYDKERD